MGDHLQIDRVRVRRPQGPRAAAQLRAALQVRAAGPPRAEPPDGSVQQAPAGEVSVASERDRQIAELFGGEGHQGPVPEGDLLQPAEQLAGEVPLSSDGERFQRQVITVEYILPLLMDELVHGQTEFSPIILPSVIIIGSHLPPERFSKEISPLITQLFGRKDRATRLQLLKNLESYIQYIDKKVINSSIFPQVIIGFGDTSANMKEATIRTMIPLTPYLDNASQVKMIRSMAPLQEDPLPALRTNVLVCLNKIVGQLDPDVRRSVGASGEREA